MKEFIDKLISRLEKEKEGAKRRKSFDSEISYSSAIGIVNQLAEEYEECFKDCEKCEAYNREEHYCPKWCYVIKNTVKEMVENESALLLTQLLEAKRNCGEDSDCSGCIFGQIEDRCILAELQKDAKAKNDSVKGDLISRSETIQRFIDEVETSKSNMFHINTIKRLLQDIEQPTVCNDGWIPCSSGELPKSGKAVIISYKDRFLTQADGTCEGWYDALNMMWHLTDYECSDNAEVIAWRERLAPYQPKGE